MFGAYGPAVARTSVPFMSRAAIDAGVPHKLGLQRRCVAVRGCLSVGKQHLVRNSAMPHIAMDPDTYEVRVDGVLATCEPAERLPLAQRYFLV
jgi:urease subunit alpha